MTREVLDLPWDLVEEILSRVPAISLRRLRFTCKLWNTLFKDPKFIQNHLGKAAKQNMVLMLSDSKIYSMSVNLNNVVDKAASTLLNLKDFHNSEKVKVYEIFQCDGLLLCTTRDFRVVVWNPCTGQTKWIQYNGRYGLLSEFSLGYAQNHKSCRKSYKILRYSSNHREIYDISSGSWRDLRDFAPNYSIYSSGVSLKGNTYLIALDEQNIDKLLLSFDFSTERFANTRLDFPYYDAMALSVVREEQRLSVLCKSYNLPKIEIWMTTTDVKIDQTKNLSWSKFLSVGTNENICDHYNCLSAFFIDEEKKAAVLCGVKCRLYENNRGMVYIIGEYSLYRKILLGDIYPLVRPLIYSYVPSLVQIE